MDAVELDLTIERPVAIRKKVYDHLREQVLSGRITSGTRLVEAALAKQINVSRTPVREALHLLEMEGLVESMPRVGYRVRGMEWDEVEEICEIRVANETLAGRWAVKRMTEADFSAMAKNIRLAEEEAGAGNPGAFVERDAEFHEILVKASGSRRLLELCQTLRRHMLLYRVESLYLRDTVMRAVAGHRRIMERLEAGDEKGVSRAIRDHIEQSKKDIQRYAFEEKRRR